MHDAWWYHGASGLEAEAGGQEEEKAREQRRHGSDEGEEEEEAGRGGRHAGLREKLLVELKGLVQRMEGANSSSSGGHEASSSAGAVAEARRLLDRMMEELVEGCNRPPAASQGGQVRAIYWQRKEGGLDRPVGRCSRRRREDAT